MYGIEPQPQDIAPRLKQPFTHSCDLTAHIILCLLQPTASLRQIRPLNPVVFRYAACSARYGDHVNTKTASASKSIHYNFLKERIIFQIVGRCMWLQLFAIIGSR